MITAPDPEWLLEMTRTLLIEGICASVHHFSAVRSIYRWQGEIVERTEVRASLHTRTVLVERIKAEHCRAPLSRSPALEGVQHVSSG